MLAALSETFLAPLLAINERQAERLEAQAEIIGSLRTENAALRAAQTPQEAQPAPEPAASSVESPVPYGDGLAGTCVAGCSTSAVHVDQAALRVSVAPAVGGEYPSAWTPSPEAPGSASPSATTAITNGPTVWLRTGCAAL